MSSDQLRDIQPFGPDLYYDVTDRPGLREHYEPSRWAGDSARNIANTLNKHTVADVAELDPEADDFAERFNEVRRWTTDRFIRYVEPHIEAAREVLRLHGFVAAAEKEPFELLAILDVYDSMYRDVTAERSPEIEGYREEVHAWLTAASANGRLPLTEAQIDARLTSIEHSLVPSYVVDGAEARFNASDGRFKAFDSSGDTFRITIKHEYFHGVSGTRLLRDERRLDLTDHEILNKELPTDRKIGLRFQETSRSANEAFTDLLACAQDQGVELDFTATGDRSRDEWNKLRGVFERDQGAYIEYKRVFFDLYSDVDFSLVSAVYYKSDFDNLEEDKLAGTHAVHNLWEALIKSGGPQRIGQMRFIERTVENAYNTIAANHNGDEASIMQVVIDRASDLAHAYGERWTQTTIAERQKNLEWLERHRSARGVMFDNARLVSLIREMRQEG